jgi:alpha-L-fucosidase
MKMNRREFIQTGGLGSAALLAPGLAARSLASAGAEGTGDYYGSGRLDHEAHLRGVEQVIGGGPFRDTWESLLGYRAPAWYQDAKFGIFIHWGVYSVPAYGTEWYPRKMYQRGNPVWLHHRLKWGPQDKFGYKDFIPRFRAENFDPDRWIELFKKAGAHYVVPVAEHHDGFAMYDCGFSEWNAVRMGPKRDVIRELSEAARRQGLKFGVSSHRAEHWWFFNGGRKIKSDVNDPRYASLYGPAQPDGSQPDEAFLRDWLARSTELVDLYRPDLFYFDWWIEQPVFEPYRRKFAAYYYDRAAERGQGAVLNYKNKAFPEGAAVLDLERTGLSAIRPLAWQTDTSVSFRSWGYIDPKMERFNDADRLIGDLVDTVSKGGVLLLNVGPAPDGTIPDPARDILLEIGRWLEKNGEAIYGTRPWKVFGEGPTNPHQNKLFEKGEMGKPRLTERDIRFTRKGDVLYALVMGWPQDGRVEISSLGRKSGLAGGEVSSIRLLGHPAPKLEWTRAEEALTVTLPADKPCEYAVALELKGLLNDR